MFLPALVLTFAAAVPAPLGALAVDGPGAAHAASPECEQASLVAVAFDDVLPAARAVLVEALNRACFAVVEIRHGGDEKMRAAARARGAARLVIGRAGLVEAMQDARLHGVLFTVELTAFDVEGGARAGRVMRQATLLGNVVQATSTREARRIADDAVSVLAAQLAARPAPCLEQQEIVVLWHKDSDPAGKAAVRAALEARCLVASEELVGMRAQAMELARDLGRPLLAVKTSALRGQGDVKVTVDRIDTSTDELHVLVHATEHQVIPGARDEAEAWAKAVSLVNGALDRALAPR
jgi:hypothetical protein